MRPKRLILFWALVIGQALGAAIILWAVVPLYRELAVHASDPHDILSTRLWATAGLIMIQVAYWIAWPRFRNLTLPRQILLGHLFQFAARLNFVFVGAMFGVAYLARPEYIEFRLSRCLLLICILFSMCCFSLQLERIAKAFAGSDAFPDINSQRSS
jgi:hypothetical protein